MHPLATKPWTGIDDFTHICFHYWDVDHPGRAGLGLKHKGRGLGTIEVQTMISRDGLNWKRYPRSAYVGIGEYSDMGKYYMVTMVQGMVQRLDGFVSINADYTGGRIVTRLLKFQGNRLKLNFNTGADGYTRVGILDENNEPIEGYSVADRVWINGNAIEETVEWLGRGADLSTLSGRVIRLQFEMRGTKLFAMQFTED